MKVTEGITWILAPARDFRESVAFFRDTLGLPVAEEGVPSVDTQFTRYAVIKLPNGVTLEIVEPHASVQHLFDAPVLSFTVDDVANARQELVAQNVEFLSPIFDAKDGWGWTYLRGPDRAVYQLQGPYRPR